MEEIQIMVVANITFPIIYLLHITYCLNLCCYPMYDCNNDHYLTLMVVSYFWINRCISRQHQPESLLPPLGCLMFLQNTLLPSPQVLESSFSVLLPEALSLYGLDE